MAIKRGVKDFFWFKKEEYERRIKDRIKYSDERIHKERAKKSRELYNGCWSIGNGVLCCISTGGLTAGTILYDYRQRSVSKRKLELLEKEAKSRGLKKHQTGKRELWLSCVSNAVHCCTGCGIHSCLSLIFSEKSLLNVQYELEDEVPAQIADKSSGAYAHAVQLNTVQMTDTALKAQAETEKPKGVAQAQGDDKPKGLTRVQREDSNALGSENLTSEQQAGVLPLTAKREGKRQGMKKLYDVRKREFWVFCMDFCVQCFQVNCGEDSCLGNIGSGLADMLPKASGPSVQNALSSHIVDKASEAEAQGEKPREQPTTVQTTDDLSEVRTEAGMPNGARIVTDTPWEAAAQVEKPNAVLEDQDRPAHGLENHKVERHAGVQRMIVKREDTKHEINNVAVKSVLVADGETKGLEFLSNQMAS